LRISFAFRYCANLFPRKNNCWFLGLYFEINNSCSFSTRRTDFPDSESIKLAWWIYKVCCLYEMKQKKSNRNMYAKDCVILMEKNKHYARTHILSFDIFFETKIVKEHFNQHFSLIQFTHSIVLTFGESYFKWRLADLLNILSYFHTKERKKQIFSANFDRNKTKTLNTPAV